MITAIKTWGMGRRVTNARVRLDEIATATG